MINLIRKKNNYELREGINIGFQKGMFIFSLVDYKFSFTTSDNTAIMNILAYTFAVSLTPSAYKENKGLFCKQKDKRTVQGTLEVVGTDNTF